VNGLSFLQTKIPPPVIALIAAVLIYFLPRHPWLATEITTAVAVTIAICAATLDFWALITFRQANTTINPLRPEQTTALVKLGPFRFSRNPMYLGLIMLLMAWGLYLQSLWSIPVILAVMLYLTQFQIKPEEAILREKYPDDYAAYCRTVGRWLTLKK